MTEPIQFPYKHTVKAIRHTPGAKMRGCTLTMNGKVIELQVAKSGRVFYG